jgi:3-keto-5-aminohexanoate cleavage enzyme
MKNVVAMARAGTLPRGSKLNIYFAPENVAAMAPPVPEALELYLKMMEGLDLKWSVGSIGEPSIMDTPLARIALERGGSFRVGLEDWGTGPSNLEQIARAKEIINAVGRPIVTGAEAIEYLDIPFAATRPG